MLIGITPGRALRWGPRWLPAEHAVLFDATSGDYWVLSEAARRLLETLERDGPAPWAGGAAGMGCTDEAGRELITELSRSGLLVGWEGGRPVSLAAFVDTAA